MRIHAENIVGDDTDVLAGTALDQLEAGGQLDLLFVSSQADGVISITGPDSEPIATAVEVPSQSRAPSVNDDPAYSIPVRTGGHFTVNYNETTGAVLQFLGIYRKKGVDF